MILLTAFAFVPLVYVFVLSLFRWNMIDSPRFVGVSNYVRLLTDSLFWASLWNTSVYTIGSLILGLGGALVIALALNAVVRMSRLYRVAYFLPSMASAMVSALVFLWLFEADLGLLNYLLSSMGLARLPWLTHPRLAMLCVVLVGSWRGVSYNVPIFLAGLQAIPREHHEAAAVDGASTWQAFRHVTLPGLRPVLTYTVVMGIIGSFQVIAQVDVLTDGGPLDATMVLIKYIARQAFDYNRMGYASALSVATFLLLLGFTILQVRRSMGAAEAQ
jgi:ABC-type sugar transport system permease subunit